MTDIRIATDYLQDLFAKLAAGRQDPARVDWPFAEKAWRAVCGEIERLRGEIERPQPVPQWLLKQYNVHLQPCPFCKTADKAWLLCLGSASDLLDIRYFVQCETCAAQGPVALFSHQAVAGWNRVQKELELGGGREDDRR